MGVGYTAIELTDAQVFVWSALGSMGRQLIKGWILIAAFSSSSSFFVFVFVFASDSLLWFISNHRMLSAFCAHVVLSVIKVIKVSVGSLDLDGS